MTPEQLTANRLYLATEDMGETKRYLEAYIDLADKGFSINSDHCNAILQLAIICYCRCFIWSNTRGKADTHIPIASVSIFQGRADLNGLHKLLIKKRHQLIAHKEWKSNPTELVHVITEGDQTTAFRKSRKYNPCAGVDVELFRELISELEREFGDKCFELDTMAT